MSTAQGCAEQAGVQDEDVLAFFESDPSWSLEDDGELTLSDGSIEVVFTNTEQPS